MEEWQPARLISGCQPPDAVQEYVDQARQMIVRIRPSLLPCDFCGGKAFVIHPADAAKIQPENRYDEMYCCEKDVLTD